MELDMSYIFHQYVGDCGKSPKTRGGAPNLWESGDSGDSNHE